MAKFWKDGTSGDFLLLPGSTDFMADDTDCCCGGVACGNCADSPIPDTVYVTLTGFADNDTFGPECNPPACPDLNDTYACFATATACRFESSEAFLCDYGPDDLETTRYVVVVFTGTLIRVTLRLELPSISYLYIWEGSRGTSDCRGDFTLAFDSYDSEPGGGSFFPCKSYVEDDCEVSV